MANFRRTLTEILILLQTNFIVQSLTAVTSGKYRIVCARYIQSQNKICVINFHKSGENHFN